MKHSDSLANIAPAIVAASGEFRAVPFDSTNPFLKNRYASLGALIEASREILAKHGLAMIQLSSSNNGGVCVETVLMHTSGEFISETIHLAFGEEKGKSRAQVAGSIITYLRRYCYASLLNLYGEEDTDGNPPNKPPPSPQPRQAPNPAQQTKAEPNPEACLKKFIANVRNANMERESEEWFVACGKLLATETLDQLPAQWVPTTKDQYTAVVNAIESFCNGEPAKWPEEVFDQLPLPLRPKKGAPTARPPEQATDQAPDGSEFWSCIVPVPRKGQKRDEYLKDPDTILSLYNARHEDETARNRLFGFLERFEPKGWEKRDGTPMPPSDDDIMFRQALDAFGEWLERNHVNT